MTLGDGIMDVRTSPNDRIWVSYFDEGVFGNHGWGGPGPEPIGSAGLVSFDGEGAVVARFDCEAAGTDRICDAYATNVVGDDDVWCCFYTDFPIVRMHAGGYSVWPPPATGPSAIVVHDERVMLVGGHQHRARARVIDVGAMTNSGPTDYELLDEKGARLEQARFLGVGAKLYAITDRTVRLLADW